MPNGSTMLLFTDGLIERRDDSLELLLETLSELADQHRHLELPEMINAILSGMFTKENDDDVVLLGLRFTDDPD